MIKTLDKTLKQEKEPFVIPKKVQDTIPIRRIWPDGIFLYGDKFSKCWRFEDINYAIAAKDDKTEMFLDYSELLNALDSGATAKITINNRRINRADFEKSILLRAAGDKLDELRREYNEMLLDKVTGSNNSIVQERYITISVHKKSVDEARAYFARVGTDLTTHLGKLSSYCTELDAAERLRIFHDFFREGHENDFHFDMKASAKKGHGFKESFAPQSMEYKAGYFKSDGKFGRVLYLREYASYIKDSMISELCELNRNLVLSIDIIPIPTDEAVREMQNKLLGIETNVSNWQRKQNAANNFSAVIPYDMELQRKETKEFLDDLTTRDQRMMFVVVTLAHKPLPLLRAADSLISHRLATEAVLAHARLHIRKPPAAWQRNKQEAALVGKADTICGCSGFLLYGGLHGAVDIPPELHDALIGFSPRVYQRLKLVLGQSHLQSAHCFERTDGAAVAKCQFRNLAFLPQMAVHAMLFHWNFEHG